MFTVLIVVLILIGVLLVISILLQQGSSAGLGIFGGGQNPYAVAPPSVLAKISAFLGAAFLILALLTGLYWSKFGREEVKPPPELLQTEQPAQGGETK